jgi:serine/threonine protein kinase
MITMTVAHTTLPWRSLSILYFYFMGSSASIPYQTTRNSFAIYGTFGVGGFSVVEIGKHKRTHEMVALKSTNISAVLTRSNGLSVLSVELEILKIIGSHKGIIQLLYAYHDFHYCTLGFELCTGGDLRFQIDSAISFNEPAVAFLAICIGSALDHIHSLKIIHRDIKPENIVLDGRGFPRLIDFGISYNGSQSPTGLICTQTSGTKSYCSPEFLCKTRKHSVGLDYWSLGITLCELLLRGRPFPSAPIEYIKHCEFADYFNEKNLPDFSDYFDEETSLLNTSEGYGLEMPDPSGTPPPPFPIASTYFTENHTPLSQNCINFLCGLLTPVVPDRLGGSGSKNIFLEHPWLCDSPMSKEEYALPTANAISPLKNHIRYVPNQGLPLTYLSSRTSARGSSACEPPIDIRTTAHYADPLKVILDMYRPDAIAEPVSPILETRVSEDSIRKKRASRTYLLNSVVLSARSVTRDM